MGCGRGRLLLSFFVLPRALDAVLLFASVDRFLYMFVGVAVVVAV